jgi:hypothetical protein
MCPNNVGGRGLLGKMKAQGRLNEVILEKFSIEQKKLKSEFRGRQERHTPSARLL